MKQFLKKIIIAILTFEARVVLWKYKPKIIAVTGSVGKTATKDAIHAVLNQSFYIRKSEKSYNSEIGVPLTILGCTSGWNNPLTWISNILEGLALIFLKNHYPKLLVLEVGADRPGDIKKIARWLTPAVVVVTRFGEVPVHVEFFDSPKQVIEEKSYLVSALAPDGLLVLNNDDEKVLGLRKLFGGAVLPYGKEPGSAMLASNEQVMYEGSAPIGITFKADYEDTSVPVRLVGVLGGQYTYSALAALSVGVYLKTNMVRMAQALEHYSGPPGRLTLIDGIKGTYILDDTYNSSPVAMEAALQTLREVETAGRKIAVLGDMLELGRYTAAEHKKAGERAAGASDLLIVVGLRARNIVEGALLGGMSEKNIVEFDDAQKAGKYLEGVIGAGDIILIKGSQSMRMERTVEEIMAHPEKKNQLLVRQEPEWLKR
ncbi:MAG: hypothetical protein BMS9Abin13_622 [Patescibacteria group bacterium]|nr:MAG: hypothetical protein BMS9Abin13_622 [Patescibacteria group bacterium]